MEAFYRRNNKTELSTQGQRDLDNDRVTAAGPAWSGTHLPALLPRGAPHHLPSAR